jgi:cytoskeletal protein RodZ
MNAIKDTWRQLVRRRLWPVAVLLVGALVAVPMVLAKPPEPPAAAPASTKLDAADETSSFVALAQADETTERRRVLGEEKDPFEPKALPKAKKSKKKKTTADPEPTAEPTPKPEETSGGSGGGGTSTPPPAPEPTAVPTPTATVPAYSVKVRFGTTETADLSATIVERLSVLPNEENPVLVYRGVEDGGKVAVFELTGQVDAQGDGECEPTPENCQYLKLRAGETEFITITDTGEETDAQYQLDVVKIYKKATKVAADAVADEQD